MHMCKSCVKVCKHYPVTLQDALLLLYGIAFTISQMVIQNVTNKLASASKAKESKDNV